MSEYVYAGLTSQTIDIFLQDSSSATGEGLAGLAYNTGSLVASYRKGATGSRAALSLATQTVGGAWSSGGFVEIDATNMKGVYRLDIPNTVVDTEGFVTLYFYGATNLLATALRIDCRPLPVDVKKFGGTSGTFASGIPEVKVASMAADSLTAAAISTDAGAELAALVETYIVNEGDATAVLQAVADKIAADWVAGDASPLAIASAVWANATRTITGGILTTSPPTTSEILTALGTGSWATSLASQSSVTQIVNALPTSGFLAGAVDAGGAAELNTATQMQIVNSVLATALTESYAADGVSPTLTQAILLVLQHMSESSVNGLTKTVKKLDGTTTAATFTLDSATRPTTITRST